MRSNCLLIFDKWVGFDQILAKRSLEVEVSGF